jgi:hypothetical protein
MAQSRAQLVSPVGNVSANGGIIVSGVTTAGTFGGNFTGTAATATNFYGTLTGNVTGNLTGTATTARNLNTVVATTSGAHFLLFSPVNGGSGVAVSSENTLQFNPATNVLSTDVFSGNFTGTAATATNFYGTLIGNVTGTATTAQNVNLAAGANNANHAYIIAKKHSHEHCSKQPRNCSTT